MAKTETKPTVAEAAADARIFLKQFRSLVAFAENIVAFDEKDAQVGAVEELLTKLEAQVEAEKAKLAKIKADVKKAEEASVARMKDEEAKLAKQKAEADAYVIEARHIGAGAIVAADNEVKDRLARAEAKHADVQKAIDARMEELAAVDAEYKKLSTALEDLKKKFA